jgi:hypothetical protein
MIISHQILCINFQSGLKIPLLIIRFFGNERRSVPRLQLHLGDIAYKLFSIYFIISASFNLMIIYCVYIEFALSLNIYRRKIK